MRNDLVYRGGHGGGSTRWPGPSPPPPGICFNFHSGRGGGRPPLPPPPFPPQLKCTQKPGFWEHFLVMGKIFRRLRRMPYTVYILLHVCSIYLVFQTTMPQHWLSMYFSSPVPLLPRAKREGVIDALFYFRFKDRITGHKRQKAEVPSDLESVDDEALSDNFSDDVSHSGRDSGLSSSSGSDGGSSSGESNSDSQERLLSFGMRW